MNVDVLEQDWKVFFQNLLHLNTTNNYNEYSTKKETHIFFYLLTIIFTNEYF